MLESAHKVKQNKIKCVVVGDGAIGKTCLIMSYVSKAYPINYVPSLLDNYTAYTAYTVHTIVDDIPINFSLWDTTSNARLRPLSYSCTDVFVLGFSIISPPSFENVKILWYPEIMFHNPITPYILCGMKLDLRTVTEEIKSIHEQAYKPITFDEGKALAKEIGAASYVECSALDVIVSHVFTEAMRVCIARENKLAARESKCLLQ